MTTATARAALQKSYTRGGDLDRDAILLHNVRLIFEQGGTAEDVAETLILAPAAAAQLLLRAGVPPPCPVCGSPRYLSLKTCGSRSCVAALRNRSQRGVPLSPEHREKIRAGNRAHRWTAEHRANQAAAMGRPGVRARIGAAFAGRHHPPDCAHCEGLRGRPRSAETRARISETQRRRASPP